MPTLSETLALAWQYLQSRNFAQMELLCRQILAADAGRPEAWRLLGKAAQAQGRIVEAIAHFQRALQLHQKTRTPTASWESPRPTAGQLEQATATFREGLSACARQCQRGQQSGRYPGHASQTSGSYRLLPRAQSVPSPIIADYYTNLANALFDTGRYQEAAASYRQVIQFQSNSAGARQRPSKRLCATGKSIRRGSSLPGMLAVARQLSEGLARPWRLAGRTTSL